MNNKEFHKFIEKPHTISEKQIEELETIIRENPYFASARLLRIIDLIKNKDPKVYEELRKSSLYIHDKKFLYDELLTADISENETSGPDISKGPVGVGLGENKIEKNDFTNEILDEITIIGKGVKDTVLESFIENQIEGKTAEPQEEKPITEAKKEPVKEAPKPETTAEKESDKKEAEPKENKAEEVKKEEPAAQKKSLADEVMESLAQMKKDREERLKKMEALEKREKERKSEKDSISKTESKAESKKKKDETPSQEKVDTKSKKTKKASASKSKKSSEKSKAEDTKKKSEKREEKKPNEEKVKSDQKIIEKFINKNPRIKPPKESDSNQSIEDLSKSSTELPSNLVSENLANIFEKQGKISKAIAIYKQLILKYPEKKSYFAQKLETLEK